jgi:hypothetical protein
MHANTPGNNTSIDGIIEARGVQQGLRSPLEFMVGFARTSGNKTTRGERTCKTLKDMIVFYGLYDTLWVVSIYYQNQVVKDGNNYG